MAAVAAMCALAPGAGMRVDTLPPFAFADTEVSTNLVFDAGAECARLFRMSLELSATASNNVTVAFGCDMDGDGALSIGEADLEVGWCCGTWYYRDRRCGVSERTERADGRRMLLWELALTPDRKAKSLNAKDGGMVFDSSVPATLFDPEWNMFRVTARGLSPSGSRVVAQATSCAMAVSVR